MPQAQAKDETKTKLVVAICSASYRGDDVGSKLYITVCPRYHPTERMCCCQDFTEHGHTTWDMPVGLSQEDRRFLENRYAEMALAQWSPEGALRDRVEQPKHLLGKQRVEP